MLRFAFHYKRLEDRPRFYRLYLRDHINPRTTTPADPEEIEKTFHADTKREFSEPEASQIKLWAAMAMEKWKRESAKARAIKMARASWSKKGRLTRKTLAEERAVEEFKVQKQLSKKYRLTIDPMLGK